MHVSKVISQIFESGNNFLAFHVHFGFPRLDLTQSKELNPSNCLFSDGLAQAETLAQATAALENSDVVSQSTA